MSDVAVLGTQTRYHLAEGLQRSLVPGGGSGLNGTNVAVLGAWGLGGLVFAARRFRWEAQGDRR